jgi:uncharacterized repeat protein (TIGR01451 family)
MLTRFCLDQHPFRTFMAIAILATSLPLTSSVILAQEGAPTEGSIEAELPSAARRLAPGLRLYTACDPAAVAPGGRVTCTVTAVNESDEDLSNLKLSARLPRGLSLAGERGGAWRGSIASLPVDESASAQFALDVGPDLPGPQAFEVEARAGAKTLAAATGIVGVGGTETQWVSRNGGELAGQGGRVRVEFPGGALRASAGARVSARAHEQRIDPRGRARDDRDEEPQGRSGTLLRFSLEAEDAGTGENIEHFDRPVSVSVDLRGLVDEAGLPAGQHVYLAYVVDADTGEKKEVDSVYDAEAGLLTAEVDHFSEWEIGMVGEGWKPILTPPVPDLFSGAATYSYPIPRHHPDCPWTRCHSLSHLQTAQPWALPPVTRCTLPLPPH